MSRERENLRFIDLHSVEVDASLAVTWRALGDLITSFGSNPAWRLGAALLGCRERESLGAADHVGSTIPGFRVIRSEESSVLELEGSHRFSEFTLTFRLDSLESNGSIIAAESRASFPGLHGAAYRALVVGSHGHRVAVGRLLMSVKDMAESRDVDKPT